jgi:acyl-CoA thioester hydrolase
MDMYGVVNNVAFFRLLEEARVDLIWRVGSAVGDAFFRRGSVVVRQAIEYKRPLVHRAEPVPIEMWVSDLQAATVAIDYEVKDGDKIYALASTTMAPYDYEKRYPRRLNEAETSFFQRYLEDRRALA